MLIGAAVVSFCGGFLLEVQSRMNPESDLDDPRTTSDRNLSSERALARANYCSKVVEDGEAEDLEKFLQHLATLSPDDEEFLLNELDLKFHHNPEKYGSLIQDLSQIIFATDETKAFDFMLWFSRAKPLLDVERYLYARSLEKDPSTVLSYFEAHVEDAGYDCGPQLEQVASIYTNEKRAELGQWLEWLDELDQEEQWDLVRGGSEATARHAAPEQRKDLLDHFVSKAATNKLLWHLPSVLIEAQVLDDPETAALNLRELPTGPWKLEALENFLLTIGEVDPQVGVDLMVDPLFMENFTESWTLEDGKVIALDEAAGGPASREAFFDKSLGALLDSIGGNAPEVVLSSSESFYDPELRKIYRQGAVRIISGEAFQAEFRAPTSQDE